jgi:hypothetical protein
LPLKGIITTFGNTKMKNIMKYAALLLLAFTFSFKHANAQATGNGLPWDALYKIPKDETRTIKGEKGKIIFITYWRSSPYEGVVARYDMSVKKKDAKTLEKVEMPLDMLPGMNPNYLVREDDELTIESHNSILLYLSGYIYEVH